MDLEYENGYELYEISVMREEARLMGEVEWEIAKEGVEYSPPGVHDDEYNGEDGDYEPCGFPPYE